MHAKDDLLQACVDHQLTPEVDARVHEHLAHCTACAKRYTLFKQYSARMHERLDALSPAGRDAPAHQTVAYARFFQTRDKRMNEMNSKRRPMWAGLAVIVMLALTLVMPPVRAWASGVLGIFRVQQVTVISFDPAMMQDMEGALSGQEEAMEQLFKDNVTMNEGGDAYAVDSAQAAADAVGYAPRLPVQGEALSKLMVSPGADVVITIDQPKMQAMLDVMEAGVTLPADVDGGKVTITVEDAVIAAYGDGCPSAFDEDVQIDGCTLLMQLPAPQVTAPEGLDVPAMGKAMFQFLGLPADEAAAMANQIDWTNTLVLPIPRSADMTSESVMADGVQATLIQDTDNDVYSLVWVKDGMVYLLSGRGGIDNAATIVNSLP